MPISEQQPRTTELEALDVKTDLPEQIEQRHKTIAVRVEEQLHSQLQFIAQLGGTSISEEIRVAIQSRIDAAQDDPALIERARTMRAEIEREAAARTAAIAGFMGERAVRASTTATRKPRRNSNSKGTNE